MSPRRLYVTGTDTDVGKTIVSAALCAAWGWDYWKPIQSGSDTDSDRDTVAQLSGAYTWPEAWRLPRPASPHAAAEDIDVRIDPRAIALPDTNRLIVEGAGGWMVPCARHPWRWQSELVQHLGLPVIVVARSGLGTLNHTLLTLRAIRADECAIYGLVLVGDPHPENERDLAELAGCPVLARLDRVKDLRAEFPRLVDALRPTRPTPTP